MFAAKDTLLTRPSGGYQISRSLRFNSADSAYLNRTPASAGNRKTYTISVWCKRASTEGTGTILNARTGAPWAVLAFSNGDGVGTNPSLQFSVTAGSFSGVYTNAVFRDVSAWYHIICAVDTTQATASNRVKIYINSVLQDLTSGNYPTLNQDTQINSTIAHEIGNPSGYSNASNFYLTEYNFIDGQALTPSSFGSTNADTGVWQPKAFVGTYGTNGFYLNFSDNSNTTAATLGKDYSGNGNNWTPNNFSVTAGAGNDSLVDSPTSYGVDTGAGGTVRGNYATLNPLQFAGTLGSNPANGNLDVTGGGNPTKTFSSTIAATSEKFYAEFIISSTTYPMIAAADVSTWVSTFSGGPIGSGTISWDIFSKIYYINSASSTSNGVTCAANDVLQIAFDADTRKIWFGRNNTWNGSGNPSAGTNEVGTVAGTGALVFVVRSEAMTTTCNFGQRPFAYTAPSGFKALCTQNLPTPTIGATTATQAGKFFNPVLYTGTGSSLGVTGVGFQPDWVWVKGRSGATDHALYDAVRGVQKQLESNNTGAETTETTGLTAFGSDGFTTGALAQMNTSAATYVAWNWKANGSGSSNTSGSITSTVSASTTSGFSVVTYTGTGANATVGHGLGVAPSMVIFKFRSAVSNWSVYTSTTGAGKRLKLNSTDAVATDGSFPTTPTSSVFYVNAGSNDNGVTMVAYCFAPVAGYSAFGSYTGNGSADGPFVYTGFKPAYLMVKRSSGGTEPWYVVDDKRATSNVVDKLLLANASDSEYSGRTDFDLLSNGFKNRATFSGSNAVGETYIYMAFASAPFKFSLAR